MIDVWANYSSVDTEIVNSGSSNVDMIGNELRSIPSYTTSVGIDAFVTEEITARLHVDAQGDYFVNEANVGGEFGGYTITSLSVDYKLDWGTLNLGVNNLFDEYHEYVYDLTMDGSDTIHSAGDGRNYSVSVRFELRALRFKV